MTDQITTSTIGMFIADLIETHAWGPPAYVAPLDVEGQKRIESVEIDASDPDNLTLVADGHKFSIRIVRVG